MFYDSVISAILALVPFGSSFPFPSTVTVSIPETPPSSATGNIDPSYAGFGIESASFPDYAGNLSSPNKFSANLIDNIANKTGAPVFIRVGGTSLDNARYVAYQSQAVVRPPSQVGLNVPINITLGPSWFQSFQTLPAKWILDVPFEHATVDQSVQFAQLGLKAITDANLQSIEIGNEPNFYKLGVPGYIQKFKLYANAIQGNLSLPSGPIFQGLTVASGASLPPWDTKTTFQDGVDSEDNLKSVSYHYYQDVYTNDIVKTLANHTDTVSKTSVFTPSITYLQSSNYSSVPFVLGEVGSSLNSNKVGAPYNNFTLEAVLTSALWTVDWMLYAMSIGVDRVSMQQITGGGYSGWNPIDYDSPYETVPAGVHSPYYGYLLVADFIGNTSKSRMTNIDLQSENLAAYAAYEDNTLSRVALVNLEYWLSNSSTPRPNMAFKLDLPSDVNKVQVSKLTGPDSQSMDNITYAGTSYTYKSLGKPTVISQKTFQYPVSNGSVSLKVPASEAWLVNLVR